MYSTYGHLRPTHKGGLFIGCIILDYDDELRAQTLPHAITPLACSEEKDTSMIASISDTNSSISFLF